MKNKKLSQKSEENKIRAKINELENKKQRSLDQELVFEKDR